MAVFDGMQCYIVRHGGKGILYNPVNLWGNCRLQSQQALLKTCLETSDYVIDATLTASHAGRFPVSSQRAS